MTLTYRRGMPLGEFRQLIEQRAVLAAGCSHPYDDVITTVHTTRVVDDPRLPSRIVVVMVADCARCGGLVDQQHFDGAR